MRAVVRSLSLSAAVAAAMFAGQGRAQTPSADEAAFRDLYKQLVEINTTRSVGSCTKAAEAMQARLVAAGIPKSDTQILAPPERPQDGALIAVLHGHDNVAKPILLLAHIDVVEAKREDWERDPFKLVEENGWFYARGASNDKAMASVFADSLIRYKKEGFVPRRDIKLALTCGEETPDVFNSVKWLTQTKPEALSAAFALNEGAGGELDKSGKPVALQIQAGEKVYQDFKLEASDVGGHSSRPTKNNPIAHLSAGLAKLSAYNFPIALNPVTRGYFEAQAKTASPEVAADMRAVLAAKPDEAAAEQPHAVLRTAQQSGLHQRLRVDGRARIELLGIDGFLKTVEIDLGQFEPEDVVEAALRQTAMQRHLAAFKALDAHARTRGLALAAAACLLALAGANATANPHALLARAAVVGDLIELHRLLPYFSSTTRTRCLTRSIMPRTAGESCNSATRPILLRRRPIRVARCAA